MRALRVTRTRNGRPDGMVSCKRARKIIRAYRWNGVEPRGVGVRQTPAAHVLCCRQSHRLGRGGSAGVIGAPPGPARGHRGGPAAPGSAGLAAGLRQVRVRRWFCPPSMFTSHRFRRGACPRRGPLLFAAACTESPADEPPSAYVALGDSYSLGVGAEHYVGGLRGVPAQQAVVRLPARAHGVVVSRVRGCDHGHRPGRPAPRVPGQHAARHDLDRRERRGVRRRRHHVPARLARELQRPRRQGGALRAPIAARPPGSRLRHDPPARPAGQGPRRRLSAAVRGPVVR